MSLAESIEKAKLERLWSHTVGILNTAIVTRGTDAEGLRGTEHGAPGTGIAGLWGANRFIGTARHVLDDAELSDLRFFVRTVGDLRTEQASNVALRDAISPLALNDGMPSFTDVIGRTWPLSK
jgi:hypothetical protein